MIDAMCSECRFFSSSIFGARPGWKCAKDPKELAEHDPTNQACDRFWRKHGAVMLVRQEVRIPIRLTGQVHQRDPGEIVAVETIPEAPYWEDRTAWLRPDQLIWADNMPVDPKELDEICLFEREVAAVVEALGRLSVTRTAAEGLVEAVYELGLPITPADLVAPMKNAGRIRDLMSGVSARSIIADLANARALTKWGVDRFAEPKEDEP